MAKQGMKRPEIPHKKSHSDNYVPQLQGKARLSNEKANPIIAGTQGADTKVWHSTPFSQKAEKKISPAYSEIDTDLARDNLENDIPFADLQDL